MKGRYIEDSAARRVACHLDGSTTKYKHTVLSSAAISSITSRNNKIDQIQFKK